MVYEIVIFILVLVFIVGFIILFRNITKNNNSILQGIDTNHVNENSFQKFAKFYGETIPSNKDFDYKLNIIYDCIKNRNMTDINKISNLAKCTIPECVLKIKYLKNKRLIDDLYIDTVNMKLLPCSLEDQKLLDKFKPYIYGSHTQIAEFATTIPNPLHLSFNEHKKKLLEELLYLDKKNLLNGVKIDDIDGEIIYYTIEKRKTVQNRETIHCPNCGSLNDVDVYGKVRCDYCDSIVVGSKYSETEEY